MAPDAHVDLIPRVENGSASGALVVPRYGVAHVVEGIVLRVRSVSRAGCFPVDVRSIGLLLWCSIGSCCRCVAECCVLSMARRLARAHRAILL